MLPYRPLQELQQQAASNLYLTQPWAMQPQLGLDALGQPLPYIDLSKQDVVAQELNRLLAPVPAVAATLGLTAQPTVPAFSPPPQLKDLPLPPAPKLPEPPKSLAETLTPYPQLPEFQKPERAWQDVASQVIAGLVNPDILPYATQAFEQAYQQRVAEARDRYERAAANALNAWQAKRQLELADAQAQREYQQQLAQLQNQYQQNVYQTQAQNIQQENEQALRKWQAEQAYNQWAYEQKRRAYEKAEEGRRQEEQNRLNREIRLELQKNEIAKGMYDSVMAIYQKPLLTAAERQTALAAIPALKAVLPPEFHEFLDQVGATIQAKPSVPELNLDIERKKAEDAIRQGWAKIKQGDQQLALAQKRLAQGNNKDAWNALRAANTEIEQLRDNIRQISEALGRTVPNQLTMKNEPAIKGQERERLELQRFQMEQRLQSLEQRRDLLEQQLIFGQPAPQQPKPQPKPQPQAQPKPQPNQQPKQQPKQGTLPSGRKFVIE